MTVADADVLFALVEANREHLRSFMAFERVTTRVDDVRGFIEGSRAAAEGLDANGLYLDEVLSGTIGLRIDPLEAVGELGYWLAADAQGRGLVTRGGTRLIDYGFGELGLGRIQLQAAVGNLRSRAVAERLGMTQEGIRRDAGLVSAGRHDLVMYSILPSEWPARLT